MRLIDADNFKTRLEHEAWGRGHAELLRARDIADETPTVNAVPVRHGKWIRTGRTNVYGGYELECSECGDRLMVQQIECELYCRNCGARMDEE